MQVAIFGGTGATGQQLIEQALSSGHQVIALARQPAKIKQKDKYLTVVQGDILEQAKVSEVVKGAEVVLSALGVRKLGRSNIVSEGTQNIIRAMQEQKVKRLVCVTGIGVGNSRPQAKTLGVLFDRFLLPVLLANPFSDKELQERLIQGSPLEWAIVRPASLTNGPLTGHYKVTDHTDFSIAGKISRSDVAHFMLSQAGKATDSRQIFSVSY